MADNKAKQAVGAVETNLFGRIQQCIDEKIRPFIQMDGGEIELVELTQEKILKVKLHGACVGCMASSITLQYGVQNAINEEFPEEDIQLQLVE
ncbi:NifU family protein [Candidatus Peregrinibacteria bacterium]|nr:NifU family protein [Candidatus Peregrinibacteria bacterium]